MGTLFSNNIYIIYILVGFSVFSLSSFEEYQRVVLFYVISFVSGLLNIMPIRYIVVLSVAVMFFMTEYFSCDKSKRELEKMLVASVGLNSTRITKDNINRYAQIIETFELDPERILAISNGNESDI